MISVLLPQTVHEPSGFDVPGDRGAFVAVGVRDVVALDRGSDAKCAVSTDVARSPWDTCAWSPPTS